MYSIPETLSLNINLAYFVRALAVYKSSQKFVSEKETAVSVSLAYFDLYCVTFTVAFSFKRPAHRALVPLSFSPEPQVFNRVEEKTSHQSFSKRFSQSTE